MARNSMQFGIKFDGLDKLLGSMRELPREMRGSVYGGAIKRAGTVIKSAAKKEAQRIKDTGLLAESIITKVKTYKGKGGSTPGAMLWVGASNDKKRLVKRARQGEKAKPSNPAKYSHLVEFGTKRTAPKPFMRPALAASSERAQRKLAEGLEKGLGRAVAKARQAGKIA